MGYLLLSTLTEIDFQANNIHRQKLVALKKESIPITKYTKKLVENVMYVTNRRKILFFTSFPFDRNRTLFIMFENAFSIFPRRVH